MPNGGGYSEIDLLRDQLNRAKQKIIDAAVPSALDKLAGAEPSDEINRAIALHERCARKLALVELEAEINAVLQRRRVAD